MKRFQFSLQAVVVMRGHRELRARQALAAATQACGHAETRLHAAQARASETAVGIAAARTGIFRAGDQTSFLALHRRECAAMDDAASQLAAARIELGRRRDACVEAQRQLKIVTRLEEKARAAHRLAGLALEQNQMDEYAGQRAGKKKAQT
jgi:flagellar export protein FliJ